jgi:hypothetical protein
MNRREQWRKVLDQEVQRWSAMPYEQLMPAWQDCGAYEVEFDAEKYQVEVEMLENTEEYIHLVVAVDDGSLPASLLPVTRSFIRRRPSFT